MANEKRLIDANALLEKFQFRLPINDHIAESIDECVKISVRIIKDAPTVDAVEVVHGRWVHKGAWHIECSECKYILAHIGEAKNYCPNCGAKMDGGNEDG